MKFKKTIAITILAILLAECNFALAAFGVSPPYRKIALHPGDHYEYMVTLLRDKKNIKEAYRILPEFDENSITYWIKIMDRNKLVFQAGKDRADIRIALDIPPGTEEGTYKNGIGFTMVPVGKNNKPGVGIALGARSDIEIFVINPESRTIRYKIKKKLSRIFLFLGL